MNIFKSIGKFFKRLFRKGGKEAVTTPDTVGAGLPQDGSDLSQEEEDAISSAEEWLEIPSGESEQPPLTSPVSTPPTKVTKPRYMWCLDNGHGKKTPGKRSPLFDDKVTRLFEYQFNRDIVKRIQVSLKAKGVSCYITVPEINVDDFLAGRVERANNLRSKLPKIFVSVHANAAPAANPESWAQARGIETWYFHGSRSGQKLAAVFQKHLIAHTGFRDRKIKSKPENQFYVLSKTTMPAILTENGFFNHKAEALELMKPSVRQKIADAHVAAILEIERNGL